MITGRPGGVLVDGEIAGTWRARKAGSAATASVELRGPASPALRTAIGEQSERLAAFRRLRLSGVEATDWVRAESGLHVFPGQYLTAKVSA